MFKTDIKNLNVVLKQLKQFGEEAEKEVEVNILATAQDIELEAKSKAPVDLGFLRNQIASEKIDELNYKVVANAPYSAYMEFGTGGEVEVPKEMRDIAHLFKGRGERKVNIRPRPFLYPAFVNGRKNLIKDLERLLNNLGKKYS